jgi:hypothetical protein
MRNLLKKLWPFGRRAKKLSTGWEKHRRLHLLWFGTDIGPIPQHVLDYEERTLPPGTK